MSATHPTSSQKTIRSQTGIQGLDDILFGGLPSRHLYLVEGDPGTGKTTLALQFLREGLARGEKGLYVTLSESKAELLGVAESHGWSLDQIPIFEMTPQDEDIRPDAQYTVFHPSEIELADTTSSVLKQVISYTNVAADHLREQLGTDAVRADITTIHSFLYRHVVRPYVQLLCDAAGCPLVNVALLEGHDEHRVNYQNLKGWLTSRNLQQLLMKFQAKQLDMLQKHIATIHWQQATSLGDWRLVLRTDYGLSAKTKAQLTPESLFAYKQRYWSEGRVDHDDVLYFAFRVLSAYPLVRECLSARFPFIFVDEFQDTVPAQTQIVRWLADAGSAVVVIGDAEQAIFEFAGAAPDHFREFALPDLDEYEIAHNRRSTQKIISLLNHVRTDGLQQECSRQVVGAPVQMLVGTALVAASYARANSDGNPVLLLSRNQDIVDELLANRMSEGDDPWMALTDAPSKRADFLRSISASVTFARAGRLDLSMKTMRQGVRHHNGMLKEPFKSNVKHSALHRRAIAVSILEAMLSHGSTLDAMTIRAAYEHLSRHLAAQFSGLALTKITSGGFAKLANELTMGRLFETVALDDANEIRDIRTIHKAKGTESDHVLVCLHSTRDDRVQHILKPSAPNSEEQRLTYVALSRARDVLFLAVPELSPTEEAMAINLGINVVRLCLPQRAQRGELLFS